MLTYHEFSGSFSHRAICNCNEVCSVDLKGAQKAIIRARDTICKMNIEHIDQQRAR